MNDFTQLTALNQAILLLWQDQPALSKHAGMHKLLPLAVEAASDALSVRFNFKELQDIDADLARLSPALLEEVCVGEMPEPLPIHPRTFEALSIISVARLLR